MEMHLSAGRSTNRCTSSEHAELNFSSKGTTSPAIQASCVHFVVSGVNLETIAVATV